MSEQAKDHLKAGDRDYQIVPTYSLTAKLYDRMVGLYAFEQWRENFERLERRYEFDLSLIGDVACGTGLASSYLLERGAGVISLDRSPQMLLAARKRILASAARLLRQDMRYLSPPSLLSLIICASDSMNHLLCELDIRRALRSFSAALKPGGYVLFDMNTAWQLREGSDSEPWDFEVDGVAMQWLSQWQESDQTAHLRLIFPGIVNESGAAKVEVHRERAYPAGQILQELGDAGFGMAEVIDAAGLGKAGDKTRRLQFIARK